MENTGTARSVRSEPPPTPPGFISDPSAENGVGCRVYSLRWTDNGIVQITINSATQLQAYIQEDGSSARQLLVFQGLSQEYEAVLKETTGIETSFLDAHIRRRSYRPPRTTRTSTAAHCWAHYDYPELDLDRGLDDRRCSRTVDDRASEPPTYRIPTTGGSIMLCRASMWLSEKAHILFLDRAPGVSPARLNAHIGKVETDAHGIPFTWNEMDINGHTIPRGNEILSLETLLYETLRESCSDPEDQDLPDLLEDLVVDKWADLFAALSPDLPVRTIEVASFFSQALDCLERNFEVSRRRREARHQRVVSASQEHRPFLDKRSYRGTAEWEALLTRLTRQTQLLGNLAAVAAANPSPPSHPSAVQATNGFGISAAKTGSRGEDKCCRCCSCRCCCKSKNKNKYDNNYNNNNRSYEKNYDKNNNSNANTHHSIQSAENQRALNRVAYLGGVLLPFSVVSGILAIESPFGPGDGQFWVFWAVTVPLTLLTLGVIYADSIRKVQVWVEVAASGKGSSSSSSSGDDLELGSRLDIGVSRPSYYSNLTPNPNPGGRVRPPDVEHAIPIVADRMAQPYTTTISLHSAPVESVSMHDPEAAQGGDESTDESREEDEDGDEGDDEGPEPDMIVEKRWKKDSSPQQDDSGGADLDGDHWKKKNKKDIKWRKEELGWGGACATLFQLYRLKKGVPPRHLRHSDKRDRLRRPNTN